MAAARTQCRLPSSERGGPWPTGGGVIDSPVKNPSAGVSVWPMLASVS